MPVLHPQAGANPLVRRDSRGTGGDVRPAIAVQHGRRGGPATDPAGFERGEPATWRLPDGSTHLGLVSHRFASSIRVRGTRCLARSPQHRAL